MILWFNTCKETKCLDSVHKKIIKFQRLSNWFALYKINMVNWIKKENLKEKVLEYYRFREDKKKWLNILVLLNMMLHCIILDCEDCNKEHEGDCPYHGPLKAVIDTKVNLVWLTYYLARSKIRFSYYWYNCHFLLALLN